MWQCCTRYFFLQVDCDISAKVGKLNENPTGFSMNPDGFQPEIQPDSYKIQADSLKIHPDFTESAWIF